MSSGIRKVQSRIELKSENTWLRGAFRKALNGMMEQNKNVVDLTTALVVAIQKAGGTVSVDDADVKALDPNTRLRSARDANGNTTYTVYVAEQKPIATEDEFNAAIANAAPALAADATGLILPGDGEDEAIEGE